MTTSVNYDLIASEYDRRYDVSHFDGIDACLDRFLGDDARTVLEVGCGTGHWLAGNALARRSVVVGLDRSREMLSHASAAAPAAHLVHGIAEQLPFASAAIDRVFCVNALHHFGEPSAFVTESRRVLRDGGGLLTIGLDPHLGSDTWWVYDYFPSALVHDLRRYSPTSTIRDQFAAAGFRNITTVVAQHIAAVVPFDQGVRQGLVDRSATSQLLVISDEEYESGRARLMTERPALRADLRLYATIGWS